MKVLVVDDDPTMRRLVARLASRQPGAEVREAEDGVAALAAIEAEAPDLIFTDMQMPHLGGVGLLEALRASVKYREIPVVAISSVSEKAMILRMVALGIEDYLLKPLNPANAGERFDAILQQVAAKTREAGLTDGPRTALLLVDRETGYGDVVRAAVGGRFEVVDHLPPAAALAWAMTEVPAVALLGEGLPMPGEAAIASALRERGTTVILLGSSATSAAVEGVDAVVARSYAPKKLAEALEPHVRNSDAGHSRLANALTTDVRRELAAGCRQSLGILVGQESTEEDGEIGLPQESAAVQVTLSSAGEGQSVEVIVVISNAHASALAETAESYLKDPATLTSSLATHAGARVAQALLQLGWAMAPGDPVVRTTAVDPETTPNRVGILTESGQRVVMILQMAVPAARPEADSTETAEVSPVNPPTANVS